MCSYHVHAFTIYDQLNYSGQMNTINTHFVVGGLRSGGLTSLDGGKRASP